MQNYRLNESTWMSRSPGMRGLAQGAGPIFRDAAGAEIASVECGQAYTMEVPGYTQVQLQLIKDGLVTFNSAFDVPMPLYSTVCATDVGHYEVIAIDMATGEEIGRTVFDILPSSSVFGGISNTMLIGGAALAFLVLRKKRG